jgi:glycosyltransferase involved in cell wall biosynthesis
MRIVINALSVFSGGGLTSMLNLLPALDRVDGENTYILILSARQETVLKAVPERFQVHIVHFNPKNLLLRLLYEQMVLPFVLRRLGADWLYSIGNLTSVLAPCKVLLLIENSNPYSALGIHWSGKERARQLALRALGAFSDRKATVIRFLTENSRAIICARRAIPVSRTVVIPHGVTIETVETARAAERSLPERFVLTVSNIGPHKNFHTLVAAFRELVQKHNYPGRLLIVGAKLYPEYFRSLRSTIHQSQLDERFVFLDWVEPKDLPSLYQKAELFVFPSAEETFGIPVIESMAWGVPVVVPSPANDGSPYFIPYEELCGTAAQYFNAFNSSSLCDQMQRVLTDKPRREEMIAAGKIRAARYRWDDVASALVGVFEERKHQVQT